MKVCWYLITNKKKHWVFFSLEEEELIKLIQEKNNVKIDSVYHGLVKYNILVMNKMIVENIDEVDWILLKASFEAEAELYMQKNGGSIKPRP